MIAVERHPTTRLAALACIFRYALLPVYNWFSWGREQPTLKNRTQRTCGRSRRAPSALRPCPRPGHAAASDKSFQQSWRRKELTAMLASASCSFVPSLISPRASLREASSTFSSSRAEGFAALQAYARVQRCSKAASTLTARAASRRCRISWRQGH